LKKSEDKGPTPKNNIQKFLSVKGKKETVTPNDIDNI